MILCVTLVISVNISNSNRVLLALKFIANVIELCYFIFVDLLFYIKRKRKKKKRDVLYLNSIVVF